VKRPASGWPFPFNLAACLPRRKSLFRRSLRRLERLGGMDQEAPAVGGLLHRLQDDRDDLRRLELRVGGSIFAARPVTWGEAIDVPENATRSPPGR